MGGNTAESIIAGHGDPSIRAFIGRERHDDMPGADIIGGEVIRRFVEFAPDAAGFFRPAGMICWKLEPVSDEVVAVAVVDLTAVVGPDPARDI
jgi:hypothetical protein